jgi:hypothetical protein
MQNAKLTRPPQSARPTATESGICPQMTQMHADKRGRILPLPICVHRPRYLRAKVFACSLMRTFCGNKSSRNCGMLMECSAETPRGKKRFVRSHLCAFALKDAEATERGTPLWAACQPAVRGPKIFAQNSGTAIVKRRLCFPALAPFPLAPSAKSVNSEDCRLHANFTNASCKML